MRRTTLEEERRIKIIEFLLVSYGTAQAFDEHRMRLRSLLPKDLPLKLKSEVQKNEVVLNIIGEKVIEEEKV